MEAVAKLKNVPTSPRKMRLVAGLVRGKSVTKALGLLKFEANSGAEKLEKLLLSALSNWQQKNEDERIEDANLFVKEIFVDEGKMLKRLRPAPQGRGHRIRKRSNHVTVVIDSLTDEQLEQQSKKSIKATK
ncbi:50S ribosomal protein L22 [Botryobacter ruber]|uniref:50S ribosomal protein L22 n=1 Tax=Botryobacter ruber TaxID=2171629 RepID=UPI000E0AFB33|nr:50S ribosomal protein L22 [Botryobacter ruber]